MKILLVNQNKMVGKLFENIAKKLDLELVAEEHVEKILPTLEESKECFFFADDTAVDGEEYEHLKSHLEGVQLSGLLLRKGIEEFGEFTHYIKKPFLPTDILHILQRSMGPAMPQSSPSLPKDIEAVSAESDADFFKDIDSSLNQLEGLLDPIALTSQEPPKEESKEEPPTPPQETAITEPTEQPQNTAEESKAAQTTETAKEETVKEALKEDTPPQEAHDPLALNLDDLLPVDDSEDETHAGLEHDEMLEDLVQEDSPKAQDLMDNMQAMGDLMQSAKHEIEETTESDLQTFQESPASKESGLDQDPIEVLESDAKKGAESTEEPKAEPVEPDSQPTENPQVSELKDSEDLDNLELEPPAATPQPESIAQESAQEAPTEPELEQASIELETKTPQGTEPTEQEPQAQESTQIPELETRPQAQESVEQLELELDEAPELETQNLETENPQGSPELELEPQEIDPPRPPKQS
ncbi:Poly E-rich protein ChePep [Helicobacter sp. NHP21005]|uniref:hypothetical protein n=1 Tax=Helicobacter felistomachi TaxID=3040201 RepID=UPI002572AD65|nr:hypothetical protein [Helicobacter sp. NHP21005]BEG56555.1 Poly E-rich protein ChePep [Helicobacter sp. NHP21005]